METVPDASHPDASHHKVEVETRDGSCQVSIIIHYNDAYAAAVYGEEYRRMVEEGGRLMIIFHPQKGG